MMADWLRLALVLSGGVALAVDAGLTEVPLAARPWYELRTQNFAAYSCAPTQEVARLTARLEQFRQAYSRLAGQQAVASPPVVVMVFPDQQSLRPYLGLQDEQPENAGGFCVSSIEGNLIALSLSDYGARSLEKIYHEYAHYLFRGNNRFWPLWLKEGMAEVYSTIELAGSRVMVGRPLPASLAFLQGHGLMPLERLVQVEQDWPEYTQRDHQGAFYAQSWLLTHYLMLGPHAALRSRFPNYTRNLQAGQTGLSAFTNALGIPLVALERQLEDYLRRTNFGRIEFPVSDDLSRPRAVRTRPLSSAEVLCRLGDQLRRIDRLDAAQELFVQAGRLAPESPLAEEGLGLVTSARRNSAQAVALLGKAVARGSANFFACHTYALERLELAKEPSGGLRQLDKNEAREIRAALQRAVSLMPSFGPSHYLLGLLGFVQGDDLRDAERRLLRAVELDPDREGYLLTLAQIQIELGERTKAKASLERLRHPRTKPELREQAQQLLAKLEAGKK